MVFITGIDPLRAVADEKIFVEAQPGHALEDGYTDLFGAARIDRRLVDHDVAFLEHPANTGARLLERREIGSVVFVDGRRHRDDVDIAPPDVSKLARITEMRRLLQFGARNLERRVTAARQLTNPVLVDVEADGALSLANLQGERQAHVTEAHHTDSH